MKTKSMILLTAALCGFAPAPAATAQPAGDASADPKAAPVAPEQKVPPVPPVSPVPKVTPVPEVLQKNTIVVIVLADGNVMIDGQSISLAELEQRLTKIIQDTPNQAVRLRGDGDIPYQRMVAVIDVCQRAKAWNIAMGQTAGDAFAAPKAAEPRGVSKPDIEVRIAGEDKVTVEGKAITLSELEQRLAEIRKRVSPPHVSLIGDGASERLAAKIQEVIRRTDSKLISLMKVGSSDMLIRYEVFSIDPGTAAAMRREKPVDGKFYADLVSLVEKGGAVQESLMVLRCPSGQKAKLESVTLEIYPTEWDPQPAGSLPGEQGEQPPKVVVPLLAEAFETRDAGEQLEVEPVRGENSRIIELRLIANHTSLAERTPWGKGTSLTEMPLFETQRVTTNANLTEGEPFLLSTMNPPPGSKVHTNRIWFAFTTASFAE